MSDVEPLELRQEQAVRPYGDAMDRYSGAGEQLRQYTIRVTPRASGDWHLSLVTADYWTGDILANFDSRIDTLDGCLEAIEGTWAEQHQERNESDPELDETPL